MQYNNPDGKWQDVIPYMIINLEYDRDIYLSKDTVVAYAWEEDKNCEYLEVNEVIESTEFCNWTPRQRKNIIDSDLVFSPAQVTEHCCVELKDQEISQETKDRFEKLKQQYPEVFSLSSQDIGHTNLVTMHVDMETALPSVKSLTHYPLSITAGFNKKSRHWNVWESSEKASALGPAQLSWYPRNLHLVNPQDVECAWISEKSTNSSQKYKGR